MIQFHVVNLSLATYRVRVWMIVEPSSVQHYAGGRLAEFPLKPKTGLELGWSASWNRHLFYRTCLWEICAGLLSWMRPLAPETVCTVIFPLKGFTTAQNINGNPFSVCCLPLQDLKCKRWRKSCIHFTENGFEDLRLRYIFEPTLQDGPNIRLLFYCFAIHEE